MCVPDSLQNTGCKRCILWKLTTGNFISVLCDITRYGWVPKQDDVPTDVADRYQWVPNISITHMEILHGGFRANNPNAAFFIRKRDGYLADIPQDVAEKGFVDKAEIAKEQMKVIKGKVLNIFQKTWPISSNFKIKLKEVFSDSNNMIILWHESQYINKKAYFQKFS